MGWWDWASIVLSPVAVVAFLMAIQPFLQLWFGGARLSIAFEKSDIGGHKVLEVRVYNKPISNRLGRFLRLRRESADDVCAIVSVREHGTNKTIVSPTSPLLVVRGHKEESGHHVCIPASLMVHAACLILRPSDNGLSLLEDLENHVSQLVELGEYDVTFTAINGAIVRQARNTIVIHASGDFYWGEETKA